MPNHSLRLLALLSLLTLCLSLSPTHFPPPLPSAKPSVWPAMERLIARRMVDTRRKVRTPSATPRAYALNCATMKKCLIDADPDHIRPFRPDVSLGEGAGWHTYRARSHPDCYEQLAAIRKKHEGDGIMHEFTTHPPDQFDALRSMRLAVKIGPVKAVSPQNLAYELDVLETFGDYYPLFPRLFGVCKPEYRDREGVYTIVVDLADGIPASRRNIAQLLRQSKTPRLDALRYSLQLIELLRLPSQHPYRLLGTDLYANQVLINPNHRVMTMVDLDHLLPWETWRDVDGYHSRPCASDRDCPGDLCRLLPVPECGNRCNMTSGHCYGATDQSLVYLLGTSQNLLLDQSLATLVDFATFAPELAPLLPPLEHPSKEARPPLDSVFAAVLALYEAARDNTPAGHP